MDRLKLRIDKPGEATIVEGGDTFVGQLFASCKGKIKLNNPFHGGEIHKLKDSNGKVLKDNKNPGNVGKIEKPKK